MTALSSSLNTPKGLARSAGVLYLLIAVAGGFAIGYLPTIISVPGATPSPPLRAWPRIWALPGSACLPKSSSYLAEIGLTAILFHLLAPVSEMWSRTAAWSRLMMVAIMGRQHHRLRHGAQHGCRCRRSGWRRR